MNKKLFTIMYFEKKIEKNNKKIYCMYKYVIIIKYKIIKKNKNFF